MGCILTHALKWVRNSLVVVAPLWRLLVCACLAVWARLGSEKHRILPDFFMYRMKCNCMADGSLKLDCGANSPPNRHQQAFNGIFLCFLSLCSTKEVDALVRFEVILLSGVSQTITCMPTAPWSEAMVFRLVLAEHQLP